LKTWRTVPSLPAALQHHQQGALAFGVEHVLKPVDFLAVLDALRLGGLAVGKELDVAGIALAEPGFFAGLNLEARVKIFCHSCSVQYKRQANRSSNSGCRAI
jgi:hypothetical protein